MANLINVCRWLDLNLRPLVSEATALQTEPQLLHSDNDVTHNVPYVCFNVRITSKNFCRFSWFHFFEIFAIRLTSWSDKRHLQLTFNLESVGSFIQINGFGFLFKLPGRQAGRWSSTYWKCLNFQSAIIVLLRWPLCYKVPTQCDQKRSPIQASFARRTIKVTYIMEPIT